MKISNLKDANVGLYESCNLRVVCASRAWLLFHRVFLQSDCRRYHTPLAYDSSDMNISFKMGSVRSFF